jgi:hypothetical protein
MTDSDTTEAVLPVTGLGEVIVDPENLEELARHRWRIDPRAATRRPYTVIRWIDPETGKRRSTRQYLDLAIGGTPPPDRPHLCNKSLVENDYRVSNWLWKRHPANGRPHATCDPQAESYIGTPASWRVDLQRLYPRLHRDILSQLADETLTVSELVELAKEAEMERLWRSMNSGRAAFIEEPLRSNNWTRASIAAERNIAIHNPSLLDNHQHDIETTKPERNIDQ